MTDRLTAIHWIAFISLMTNFLTLLFVVGIAFGGHA